MSRSMPLIRLSMVPEKKWMLAWRMECRESLREAIEMASGSSKVLNGGSFSSQRPLQN